MAEAQPPAQLRTQNSEPIAEEYFVPNWLASRWTDTPDEPISPALREAQAAAELYRAYDDLATASLGSYRLFAPEARERVLALQKQINECLLAGFVAQGEAPGIAGYLASEWHAALFLLRMQHTMYHAHSHLAFRGQADAHWKLTPSVFRQSASEATLSRKRVQKFCELFVAVLKHMGFSADEHTALAAAQHYGLPTPLLDFTTDPMVAVYFALRGKTNDPEALPNVWFHHIPNLLEAGARIIVPPACVPRLHLQRGLFIDYGQSRAAQLDKLSFQIRFLPSLKEPFEVFWLGEILPLEQESLWLNELLATAISEANEVGALPRQVERVVQMIETERRLSIENEALWNLDGWIAQSYHFFYQTCITVQDNGQHSILLTEVAKALLRDNPVVVPLLTQAIKNAEQTHAAQADLQMARLLEAYMNENKLG